MATTQNIIDEQTYLSGFPLWDALFEFGNREYIELLSQINPDIKTDPRANTFSQAIGMIAANIQNLQSATYERREIINALQQGILNQLKTGDLMAYGFKEPRDITDAPIKIPADLFLSGELNWENSELKNKNHLFSGIRLLADLMSVINIKATEIKNENQNAGPLKLIRQNKNTDQLKPEKPRKQHFSDLDPALHIDEKKAAEYLGISHKTLQGYRVKGGGPQFHKFGERSVRYKIADLISWAETRKRKNTSES